MARKRRSEDTEAKDAGTSTPRNVLMRIMTADLVLRAGSYALRHAVNRGLVRGAAADAVPDHPPSVPARLFTAAASTIATRSVPGALLVGTGLLAHTLYLRGLARREERLGRAPGTSGTLPPN